jgi:glycosyltransferase involved in cell wall biosynthesis
MTAALGAYIARKVGAPLYLDIRDIFVDTMKNILPHWAASLIALPLDLVENYAMKTATKINLVSRGFESYFKNRYPAKRLAFFSNGIDEDFLCLAAGQDAYGCSEKTYSILYAGNLGEGQGLHEIIPALASAMNKKMEFTIIGDGGRRPQLQRAINEKKLSNVTIKNPVDRAELIEAYQRADVLFLHLNEYDAFKKVLPSKLFEYAATGKPIWAGVGGYAATFVSSEIENAAVFPPCNAQAAIEAFAKLQIKPISRAEFICKYDRRTIMDAFAEDVLSVCQEETP